MSRHATIFMLNEVKKKPSYVSAVTLETGNLKQHRKGTPCSGKSLHPRTLLKRLILNEPLQENLELLKGLSSIAVRGRILRLG